MLSIFTILYIGTKGTYNIGAKNSIWLQRVEPNEIGPNEYGVIAFDNNGNWNKDCCGSVSWQILQELEGKLEPLTGDGEDEKGRRLNIAYFTSFK